MNKEKALQRKEDSLPQRWQGLSINNTLTISVSDVMKSENQISRLKRENEDELTALVMTLMNEVIKLIPSQFTSPDELK